MRRPVTTIVAGLTLALCAGLGLVFINAYRKGITIRLGESGQPDLLPPPPANTALSGGQPQHYTNEQLHSMLQEETSQLGIKRFAPRGERQEEPAASFLGPRLGAPGARAQAETAIRDITRLRHSVDAGKKKSVRLLGKTVPVLAEPETGGAAVEPKTSQEAPPKKGNHSPLQESATSPSPQVETTSPNAWSGLYGGAEEGTLTISDSISWANLWSRLSRQPVPDLDFSRQQIVGVFLGPQPADGFRVEISSTMTVLPTAVLVRYRMLSSSADRTPPEGATAPYALRAIARTALPIRFEGER